MKKIFCCFLFLLLIVSSVHSGGFGGNVNIRGQLLWPSRSGFPAPSVGTIVHLKVMIQDPVPGGGYIVRYVPASTPAITDYNGMYFIYGISPNNYVIQVERNRTIIGQYSIIVPFNAPMGRGLFFDISPIVIQ